MNFLIVDDHLVIALGLQMALRNRYPQASIDAVQTGDEAYNLFLKKDYELVVLDINVPGTNTLNLMSNMLLKKPGTRVLIFSMNPEVIFAKRYLKAGARGYIGKDIGEAEILRAVDQILAGQVYMGQRLQQKISDDIVNARTDNPFDKLSEREMEVATYLIRGYTLSDISSIMQLHSSTIGTHKSRLMDKLGVRNLIELRDLSEEHQIPVF